MFFSKLRQIGKYCLDRKPSLFRWALCFLLATGFVLVASTSTSPFYDNYYAYSANAGGDSLQFQTIGSAWLDGKVPYRDTFDHKGPLIFIIDVLGFWLGGGSRYGIVLIQVISLTIVLWYAFKFARRVTKEPIWGVVLSAVLLIALSCVYVEGNGVQEYCLPWLMASLYYLVDFLTGKEQTHLPRYALLYGATLGLCFFSQITNAVPIIAAILFTMIVLIKNKQYRNLWRNILFGCVGFLAVSLPIMIYFACQGVLGEMFYAMLVFNFKYAGGVGSWLSGADGSTVSWMWLCYLPCLLLPLTAWMAWRRGQKMYAGALLLTWLLELYMFLFTQAYVQYAQPMTLQIVLLLNEVFLLTVNYYTCRKTASRHAMVGGLLVLFFGVAILANVYYGQLMSYAEIRVDIFKVIRNTTTMEAPIGYEPLMEQFVLKEDGSSQCSSFTAYASNESKGIYLRYGLPVYNKYFIIQDWHAGFANEVAEDIWDEFATNSPECLLIQGEGESTMIAPLLSERYGLLGSENGYQLYKLR